MLTLTPQVSPDGLFWCDEGAAPLVIEGVDMASLPLREFGGWLRLDAKLTRGARIKVLIYLALKG